MTPSATHHTARLKTLASTAPSRPPRRVARGGLRRAVALAALAFAGNAAAQGPGIPRLVYPDSSIGKPLSVIYHREGHGRVIMHRGYMVTIYSKDGGKGGGGIAIVDISNPYKPVTVKNLYTEETREIREAHAWGVRGDVICVQANYGMQFWDLSEITQPRLLSYLRLPDVSISDYDNGMWWTHWQGRYVYGGGGGNGLYIVDALDPAKPVFVKQVPISKTGGFRVGSTTAIGNLLYISGFDPPTGISILDISDPADPKLLTTKGGVSSYSSMVNGNKMVVAGSGGDHNGIAYFYDVSNPTDIRKIGQTPTLQTGSGGYIDFADNHAFVGFSNGFAKFDLGKPDFPMVLWGGRRHPAVDEDFAVPLGNLVFSGDDHGEGSSLVPHQAHPDTTGPYVNMIIPANGAGRQALTSRIGVTFSEAVDIASLDVRNFTVTDPAGDTVQGLFAHQFGVVNFHPLSPLRANTTYTVRVKAGGVRDYSGNTMRAAFSSAFTTGDRRDCGLSAPAESNVRDTVTFTLSCADEVNNRILWSFGDGTSTTESSMSVRHAYSRKGIFNVFARIETELLEGATTVHTARFPLPETRPSGSATVLRDRKEARIWNVNADNNSVTVTSATTLKRLTEIPVGRSPRTLAQDQAGNIWVANQEDATLSVLNGMSLRLEKTIALPFASRPYGIAFSPDGTTGYVTLEATGMLLKIDAASFSISDSLYLFPRPRGIAVAADGNTIWATRFISPRLDGEVAAVGRSPFVVKNRTPLAYDESMDSEGSGAGAPNALASVVIAPDGKSAWVPFKKDNILRGLAQKENPIPPTFENTVRTGLAQISTETGAEIRSLRLDFDNRSMANSIAFDSGGNQAYVTTGASNHTVVLSALTGKQVSAIEPTSLTQELGPDGSVLARKDSLLFIHYALSRQLGVYDVSTAGQANRFTRKALIQTVQNDKVSPQILKGKQLFHNAADPRMSKDRYLSCVVCHMDGGGDGRVWDFTHKGEGLRRTTSLIGKSGMGHGPVHWSANFDEIQDFENDIRESFGGTGFMSDQDFASGTRAQPLGAPKAGRSADLDALAAYVSSLSTVRPSPFRNPDGSMTKAAEAGEKIFHRQDVGCAVCHSGPRYTNSGNTQAGSLSYSTLPVLPAVFSPYAALTSEGFLLHDVGTLTPASGKRANQELKGLDVPTLLGVWEGGPYLHDGSAATLMDVLTTRNTADRHGATSHLSTAEKEQLVAFLMQLDRPVAESSPTGRRGNAGLMLWFKRQPGGGYVIRYERALPGATLAVFDLHGRRLISLNPSRLEGANTVFIWETGGYGLSLLRPGAYNLHLLDEGRSLAKTTLIHVP